MSIHFNQVRAEDAASFRALQAQSAKRNRSIDALRGCCLYAVWIVNLWSFSGFREQLGLGPLSGGEYLLYAAQSIWLEGKAYPLFALLFGLGCAWIMNRGVSYWMRRMGLLFGFGLCHMLIWYGDILLSYSVIGVVLWRLRALSTRSLSLTAIFLLSMKIWILLPLAFIVGNEGAVVSSGLPGFACEAWDRIFAVNLSRIEFKVKYYIYTARWAELLGMALLGLVLQRHGPLIIAKIRENLWLILIAGSLLSIWVFYLEQTISLFPPSSKLALVRTGDVVGTSLLVAAYIGLVAMYAAKIEQISSLVAVGRMSLSVYVFQTFLAIGFFYGPFLGLYGRFDLIEVTLIGSVLFVLQMIIAQSWLELFAQGPLELLWRRGAALEWRGGRKK